MGKEDFKVVVFRFIGVIVYVKEDCVLEDNIGLLMIYIWEFFVYILIMGKLYCFINLIVKNF